MSKEKIEEMLNAIYDLIDKNTELTNTDIIGILEAVKFSLLMNSINPAIIKRKLEQATQEQATE